MPDLQKFGFKESPYERPQDKWLCGRLAEGNPCLRGPDADGYCRVTAVCQPHLEGERWQCRRSPLEGGPCDAGPLPDGECCQKLEPCIPKPSLRTVRKRVVLWASAFSVGLVALILGSEKASEFLMPGPLSSPHASQTDCRTCHADVEPGNLGWLHSFVAAVEPRDNAKLCIGCHDVGAAPFSPHTHPVDQLRQLTARYDAGDNSLPVQRDSLLHRIAFPAPNMSLAPGETTIFCATCHEEHQGAVHDQTTMSKHRCQTCHTSKFGSFADSHPEFSSYPFDRRTRIIFDHKSHFGKHFPKTKAAESPDKVVPSVCADCHRPGTGQKYMEIARYSSMCASCHDGEILGTTRASGPKGVDFLAVPGLDVATLAERGIDIGEWPMDSEAELTVFMRALIATDPKGAEIVNGVSDLDLLDLTDASDEQLGKVKAVAWSVKNLFSQLENTQLSKAMMTMPENSDGTKFDRTQMADLTGIMSRDVIMSGNREWFPNLSDDLEQFNKAEPTKSFGVSDDDQNRPTGQPLPSELQEPEPEIVEGEGEILPESDGDILGESDGDILAEESGDLSGSDTLTTDGDIANAADDDTLELGGDDEVKDDASLIEIGEISQPDDNDDEGKSAAEPVQPMDPESWAEFGGWYRQDFTIRYRPSGHSDRFLRNWLDYSGHALGSDQATLLAPIFDQLASRDAIGRCTKCHSVDNEDDFKHVMWQAFSTRQVKNRFTTFSHKPHISASGSKGCVLCHELSTSDADYMKTYDGGLPTMFAPNFPVMAKAVCSTCHTEQAAGETCTLCHNYHAAEFSRPLVKTKLQ